MENRIRLNVLGTPELFSPEGNSVASRTRAATALIAYLARTPGHTENRDVLSSMLWSESETDKAKLSLRQTLNHIRLTEKEAGLVFIDTDKNTVSLNPEFLYSDLDQIRDILHGGLTASGNQAIRLWKGDFLKGYDDIDEVFSEWLLKERETIQQEFEAAAVRAINDTSSDYSDDHVEATANFLLWIDPSDEFAHATLIRLYASQGNREKAEQQYKDCVKEMSTALGLEPSEETRKLLEVKKFLNRETDTSVPGERIKFPLILLSDSGFGAETDARAHSVRDGIVSGLSSLRSFELREAAGLDLQNPDVPFLLNNDLEKYGLRFRFDSLLGCMNVSLENKSDGLIIIKEFIDVSEDTDKHRILNAIQMMTSQIKAKIADDAKTNHPETPYALWCHIEDLLWQFDVNADRQAMELIDRIQRRHSDFSQAYAGRTSIMLKHLFHYPTLDENRPELEQALRESQKSVDLDPWHSGNRRMLGFSQIGQENWDDARHTFKQALEMNPMDPMNCLSVSEGLAFAGEIDTALKLAKKATDNIANMSAPGYEYLGNVHFSAGNFTKAAELLERAPEHSVSSLVTRAAALKSAGMTEELADVLTKLSRTAKAEFGADILGRPVEIHEWLDNRHGFANPVANQSYKEILKIAAERMTEPS